MRSPLLALVCSVSVAACYASHVPGGLDDGGAGGDGASGPVCGAPGRHVAVTVTPRDGVAASVCDTRHVEGARFSSVAVDADGVRFTSDACVYRVGGIGGDLPDVVVHAGGGTLDWSPTSFTVVGACPGDCTPTHGFSIGDGDPALVPAAVHLTISGGAPECVAPRGACGTVSHTAAELRGLSRVEARVGETRRAEPDYNFWLRSLHGYESGCGAVSAGWLAWWDYGYI